MLFIYVDSMLLIPGYNTQMTATSNLCFHSSKGRIIGVVGDSRYDSGGGRHFSSLFLL
jgi:hypothetical protein